MKTYIGTNESHGINRVITALKKYIPDEIETVETPREADVVVLHVIGRNQHTTRYAKELLQQGKQYAVIQYVLQSSRNPDPKDWVDLWSGAKIVWSYYDIEKYTNSNFYHAPLGSEFDKFYREPNVEKKYTAGSVGNCYRDEAIGEKHLAVWQAGGNAIHVGENFNHDPIVDYVGNVTDDELRNIYNQCKHFTALRRKDGFEIVAVEALLCGVRPIMFDTPNYKQWFDGLAEFIPEESVGKTVGNLKQLFKKEHRPVTEDEIEETKRRFNWKTIAGGFWERCMTSQY